MLSEVGYRFTHTISRTPGSSIADGLRAGSGPDPEPALFLAQHQAYLDALAEAGVTTLCLPALEAFPDSVFVEDPALCFPEGAILLRPGAQTRLGEAEAILPVLQEQFPMVIQLQGPGYVDGGDIMVTDREVLVGLSARTNEEGFEELAKHLKAWGYRPRMMKTPETILHFKTASSYLGNETVLCTRDMAESGLFEGYKTVVIPQGEEVAANAIRVNDTILLSAGFPKTATLLRKTMPDVRVVELDTSEAARVDGGLSCMSLRYFKG